MRYLERRGGIIFLKVGAVSKYLVVFDVDSTLIQEEVIELLAQVAGQGELVAKITDRAMRGELDFAESLISRVSTLAGLSESVLLEVRDRINISLGAKAVIAAVQAAGGKVGAVSGGFSQILTPLAQDLGLDFSRANELEIIGGILTGRVTGNIIDKQAKANALIEWKKLSGLEKTVAVGDGANDLLMLAEADIGVAFNAKPLVRDQADIVIEGNDLSPLLEILGLGNN